MNVREAFLSAVEEEEPESFLNYIEKHNSKNDPFEITEVLQTLSKKQHEKLWDGIKRLCNNAILKAAPSAEEEEEEENNEKNMSALLSCVQGVTTVGLSAITLDKPYVPASLLETAVVLHGVMMNIPDETQKVQNGIAQLCETWFNNGLEGKEELVTNTLPFLVIRSLAKGTVGDVKRIWGLRQSLLLMDLEDDSAEPLKQLLQQCMIHPIFLRAEEGRRFLSFLFGMHPGFSKELHKTIKNQIPNCSIATLSFYGEVYFRAWRVASGPYLEVLEKDCFQDLMYAAVHAQRTGVQSMSSRLRKVLSYVHQQKKQQGVDEMLVRLYQPILWRAFKVANPMVRANASALLIDAFPLQNPESSNEQADELLQKQFDILQGLFEDPSPIVRATGVHGVCRITGVFWELIPVHTIKALINKLISEVAFDASSSTVRVAVFQGLKFLLENHLSHPLLKTLLGNLRDLIHDVSEKVRSAFLDLLLLVKGIKAIKFWTIVPLEHLLACLEVETSATVLRKLVKLLMNSFHPLNKEADVQITRCAALWEANPVAARKFYQYAHLHAAVPATGKFILLLCRCLVQWAKNIAPDTSFESFVMDETFTPILDSTENKENESVEEAGDAVLTLPDIDTISGILETIAISWSGIKDQLEKKSNESIKSKLIQHFKKILPKLLTATEDARARAAIIVISANLPADCLPTFSKRCLSALSSLPDGANSQDYGPMLDCLCSWGQGGKVLDMIDSCLVKTFGDQSQAKQTGSKSEKLLPLTAIEFLFWILYQPPCREAVMNNQQKLQSIASKLKNVMILVETMTVTATNKRAKNQNDAKELYPKAMRLFCHLQMHLDNKSFKASEEMTELLLWAKNVLLPRLDIYKSNDSEASENGKRVREETTDYNCTQDILEVILSCCSELLKLGMANEQFCAQATSVTKSITQLGSVGLQFLPQLSQLMYQMTQRMLFKDVEESGETITDYTQVMLTDILRAISSNGNDDNLTQVLLNIKSPLAEVLKAYECKKQTVLSLITEKPQIMASTMAACLAELTSKTLDFTDMPSTSDLPQLSAFILGILIKSKVLLRSFVEELEQCVISGAMQEKQLLYSAQMMLSTIVNDKANSKVENLKSCGLQIFQQLEKQQVDANDSYAEQNMEQVKKLSKKTLEELGVVC